MASNFEWSGTGTSTYTAETDLLNGPVLPAPPDSVALLYGLVLSHADRLTDPNDTSPLGGRFVDSFIEIDYVAVPEPATLILLSIFVPGLLLGRRAMPGIILRFAQRRESSTRFCGN